MRLGREGCWLTVLVVMTDWDDTGSWVDMGTDPKKVAKDFLGLTVGRRTALALFHYMERGGGDEFQRADILAKHDRGFYDVETRVMNDEGPIEILDERILKQLNILEYLQEYTNEASI